MLRVLLVIGALLLTSPACANDAVHELEESFTIFLNLEDYHVSKDGSHEILEHHQAIGEHDNVVVQMSEEEMRLHMDRHDTHDCEHPADQHEIVSFVQEAMYERPAVPTENFIDDAINANYMGSNNNMWEQQMGGQFPNMMQVPMQLNQQQAVTKPATKEPAAAKPYVAEKVPDALAEKTTKAEPVAQPKVELEKKDAKAELEVAKVEAPKLATAVDADGEEEAAVARFRDAYHAMKYSDHSEQGKKEESKQTAGMFDSLFDEDDKKAMGLFMGDRKELPADAFAKSDFSMDGVLDKIVDEALGEIAPKDEKEKEHKHKHHKSHSSNGGVELMTEPTLEAKPVPAVDENPVAVEKKTEPAAVEAQAEKKDDKTLFSDDEKAVLKKLVQKLSKSDDQTKAELEKELGADESKTVEALAPKEEAKAAKANNGLKKASDKKAEKEILVASDANKADKAVNLAQKTLFEEEEEQAGLPAMPPKPSGDAKSFIGKAPKVSDYIPEAVYAQQSVSFDEKPAAMTKHVPKRILIPRMEEPGPVIGGSSRPVHIMLPPSDDTPAKGNSRPSAPVGVQAQIQAAFGTRPSSITNTADTQPPSNKVTTLASANDEALSSAEVVIF